MQDTARHTGFSDILLGFLGFILAVPLFMIAYHQVPDLGWPYFADKILLFLVILMLLLLVLRLFKPVLVLGFIAVIAWLGYGSFTGKYGFEEVVKDYRAMFFSWKNDPDPAKMSFTDPGKALRQHQILSAIDYDDPVVRNFAVSSTTKYFMEEQRQNENYRTLIQCLAIFKRINANWNYVSDPASREYFAKGSESVGLLAGDCDDYSILMAAAIKSIGGTTRLLITPRHIFPELKIGNRADLERMNFLIHKQLFPQESRTGDVNYHKDADGIIWLNLDFSAKYPGGEYINEPVQELLYP